MGVIKCNTRGLCLENYSKHYFSRISESYLIGIQYLHSNLHSIHNRYLITFIFQILNNNYSLIIILLENNYY